jgi:hypothetical protein
VITNVAIRWRERVGSYRPAAEVCDFSQYEVAPIDSDNVARAFVEHHHYSGSYPAARFRYGLFHRSGELRGVAVFSHPPHNNVLTNVFPVAAVEAVELGRFVLLDNVKANGETQFLARAFDDLSRKGIVGVVSHSDPMERANADGTLVFKGHVGGIYQAHNAVYLGRLKPRPLVLLPDGKVFSDRAASKIRNRERGWRYAIEQLVAAGARSPAASEDLREWLARTLNERTRRARHPGNHKYAWGLVRGMKKHLGPPNPEAYPKLLVPRLAA